MFVLNFSLSEKLFAILNGLINAFLQEPLLGNRTLQIAGCPCGKSSNEFSAKSDAFGSKVAM